MILISRKGGTVERVEGRGYYACGTSLRVRGKQISNICHCSAMADVFTMVESSDTVLDFFNRPSLNSLLIETEQLVLAVVAPVAELGSLHLRGRLIN